MTIKVKGRVKSLPRFFVLCGLNAGGVPPLKLPVCGAQKIRTEQSTV